MEGVNSLPTAEKPDILQVTAAGRIICPSCRKPIKGLRITRETEISRVNLMCSTCKRDFDIRISPGLRVYRLRL